jgi:hypothetical protein
VRRGWNQISLGISDLHATVATLRASGVTLRKEIAAGVTVDPALLADPSGNLVELLESRAPDTTNERPRRSEQMSTVLPRAVRPAMRSSSGWEWIELSAPDGCIITHPDKAVELLLTASTRRQTGSEVLHSGRPPQHATRPA